MLLRIMLILFSVSLEVRNIKQPWILMSFFPGGRYVTLPSLILGAPRVFYAPAIEIHHPIHLSTRLRGNPTILAFFN